jgi:twitching motility protein PilT
LEHYSSFEAGELEEIFGSITTPEQRDIFTKELELDFTYSASGIARCRVNVLRQRGTLSIAFRLVPFEIPSIDELKLPAICKDLVLRPRGLMLITGPTGSGKSTSMAAMIDYLNENEGRNIIIVEDPIEYLHRDKQSTIIQRDLGDDTKSFANALKHALRHDPDVIVLGEMRDLETIALAVTAAETGHLVLGTLHTTDVAQTVDRIIEVFPHDQQQQIRLQVSQVILAVLSQALLPRIEGGRVAACEIMIATPPIRNLIRDGKNYQIPNVVQLSNQDGMQTLDQALTDLVRNNVVLEDVAMLYATNHEQLGKSIRHPQQAGSNPPNSFQKPSYQNDGESSPSFR